VPLFAHYVDPSTVPERPDPLTESEESLGVSRLSKRRQYNTAPYLALSRVYPSTFS
jgi:hypothetical protein